MEAHAFFKTETEYRILIYLSNLQKFVSKHYHLLLKKNQVIKTHV